MYSWLCSCSVVALDVFCTCMFICLYYSSKAVTVRVVLYESNQIKSVVCSDNNHICNCQVLLCVLKDRSYIGRHCDVI